MMLFNDLFGLLLCEGRSVASMLDIASHIEVELEGSRRYDARDVVKVFLEPREGL